MVESKKRNRRYKLEKFFLPFDDSVLDQYIKTHKTELQTHVVDCIDYAVKNNLDSIEVFRFQNSPYTVNIPREDFESNVKFIFDSFMSGEKFEYCSKSKKLLDKLKTHEQ